MRSRYSAYALGGYGEYLLTTWAPETQGELTVADLSLRSTDWLGLEIVAKSQNGDNGFVEFKATYMSDSGESRVHHEKSSFRREKGLWLYVGIEN